MNTRSLVLSSAEAAVNGQRDLNYGSPEDNFARIAELWNAYQAIKAPRTALYTAVDVATMLLLVKVARLSHSPTHLDSWVDVAGYAACGAEVAGAEEKKG